MKKVLVLAISSISLIFQLQAEDPCTLNQLTPTYIAQANTVFVGEVVSKWSSRSHRQNSDVILWVKKAQYYRAPADVQPVANQTLYIKDVQNPVAFVVGKSYLVFSNQNEKKGTVTVVGCSGTVDISTPEGQKILREVEWVTYHDKAFLKKKAEIR